jgi:hypothetical protein
MEELKVVLKHSKSTKGTERYDIQNDPFASEPITTLYIRKSAFKNGGNVPDRIELTVKEVK